MNWWDTGMYGSKHSYVYHHGESLVKILDPKKNETILDVGCGSGELTFSIRKYAKMVVGMDASPEMIATARTNYPLLDFRLADAAHFCFDKKFDAIFSNAALHWVSDYKGAIKCMYGHLKSGGRLVVEFGGKGNVKAILSVLREALRRRGYIEQSKLRLWYFPSIAEYTTALEKEGFQVSLAQLYERPTELADSTTGIKDWLSMFGKSFFNGVAENEREEIMSEVQEALKPSLLINDKWFADYRRLRVVARKISE